MSTAYRIKYKIVEGKNTYSGTRIVDESVGAYHANVVRKMYPDASYVYLEFVEEVVLPDETAGESLIVLGLNEQSDCRWCIYFQRGTCSVCGKKHYP